jgi:sodium ion-translocating decarboxylase beta subunit
MLAAIGSGSSGLIEGFLNLHWSNPIMIGVGCVLLYLGIKKDFEPLLLVPIGFGAILVNIPLGGLMEEEGFLKIIYDAGVMTEIFPLLIFVGIGAMCDFGPLLEDPKIFLLGAPGNFGIFLTIALALALGFTKVEAVAIGVVGACDGPPAVYVASRIAPHLLGPITVAAYSYMSLVPVFQPPIMKLLTTKKERMISMGVVRKSVSKNTKLLFPLVVTVIGGLIAPRGLALLGTIMLGNFMKECGAVKRLTNASENEIANVVTLLLGIAIGATMDGKVFLTPQTIVILALGFLAMCLDTACGVLFAKFLNVLTGGKVNPLVGAAGISAYPMSARVVQRQGQKYNPKNYLLMHAMGANTGGQVGSVMSVAIMLSILTGMGII